MPSLAAPLIGFALGGIFAWLGREDLARHNTSLESRSFSVVIFFALLIYAPICCYFSGFATDWCFGYFIDPSRHPLLYTLILAVSSSISPAVGFIVVGGPAVRQRFASVVRFIASATLIALAVLVPGAKRLVMDATFAQFHDDFGGQHLLGSPLGYGLLWMGGVLTLASVWAATAIARLSSARV